MILYLFWCLMVSFTLLMACLILWTRLAIIIWCLVTEDPYLIQHLPCYAKKSSRVGSDVCGNGEDNRVFSGWPTNHKIQFRVAYPSLLRVGDGFFKEKTKNVVVHARCYGLQHWRKLFNLSVGSFLFFFFMI